MIMANQLEPRTAAQVLETLRDRNTGSYTDPAIQAAWDKALIDVSYCLAWLGDDAIELNVSYEDKLFIVNEILHIMFLAGVCYDAD